MSILNYPQSRLKQRIKEKANKLHILSTSHIVSLLLIIAGLASAPLSLLSDRTDLDDVKLMYVREVEVSASYTLLSRSLNGVIAILLIVLVIKAVSTRPYITIGIRNIIAALGVFFVFNYVLGSLFGLYSGLPYFFFPLSIIALMFLPLIQGLSPQKLIDVFRYVAGFMLVGSLFMGIVVPDVSYMGDPSYSFAPGGSSRLIGFFGNPSALGLYAIMLFAVELRLGARGWLHMLNLLVCPVVLVLSVSKTAIVLAAIFFFWHFASKGKLRALMVTFVLVATFGYMLLSPNVLSYFSGNENFLTLTGRTILWRSIIDAWVANPLFGNGPAFFSGSGKTDFANAHNIILQSVSDGGLFGLIGLIGYLFALVSIALKNTSVSRSLSISLVLLLLAFSMTDPVMRVDSFVSGLFFINAFVVLYLCALDRQRNRQGKKSMSCQSSASVTG